MSTSSSPSKKPHLSSRATAVQSPIIPLVGALIRSTPGTISLGQGVVAYGPPKEAIEQAKVYAQGPDHLYGPVQGSPVLVDAARKKLKDDNGIDINDKERAVMVTAGSNMGFLQFVLATCDEGDEIIFPSPYYFNHGMACTMCGVKSVFVDTDDLFQLDVPALEAAITPKTRAIVTISPNNPTGAIYTEASIRELNRLCGKNGLYHVSDEAYEYFVYDDKPHFSPCSIPGSEPHTVSFHSLSKSYGFAGWRIGFMVIPQELNLTMHKIQDTNVICAPMASQHAAAACLKTGPSYFKHHVEELQQVRDLMVTTLQAPEYHKYWRAWSCQGAFYIIIKLHKDLKDMDTVERLVKDFKVGVLPGSAFGLTNGCYFRVSFGPLKMDTAKEGLGRLVKGLKHIAEE